MSVADARSAIVSGRDEDLQVNMDALLAARDAEWRAAVARVGDQYYGIPFAASTILRALLREVPHAGQ